MENKNKPNNDCNDHKESNEADDNDSDIKEKIINLDESAFQDFDN